MKTKGKKKQADSQGLVPKLRFPEFRDTGAWEEKQLDEIATFHKGKGISKADIDPQGETPCLRYGELYTCYQEEIKSVVSKTNMPAKDLFLSCRNDVIIPSSGETKIDIATASCLLLDDVAIGGDINVVRCNQNGRFLSYYLNGWKKFEIAKIAQGDTVVHLYINQLKLLNIDIPKPEEQQKIADCLSSIDELIAAQAHKLDTLKSHKKGLMQQLFPAPGQTIPSLRFPEFRNAGEWGEYPLSKFIKTLDAGVSVNSGDRAACDAEFGILKTSAVTNGIFEPSENKVVVDSGEQKRLKEPVQAHTIIISRMNTPALVGANAYIDTSMDNIFLPDRLWSAKPQSGTSMRFIAYTLGSEKGRSALSELATGTSGSMKNITKFDVLGMQILSPDFPEQQKIADCLSSLDELIAAQTQKLDTLKAHKKGLMQQLFPNPDKAAE